MCRCSCLHRRRSLLPSSRSHLLLHLRVAGALLSLPQRMPQPLAVAPRVSQTTSTGGENLAASGDAGMESGDAPSGAGLWSWPANLYDAGPDITACVVGRNFVTCSLPSGTKCLRISDDPASCPGCGAGTGATCRSTCSTSEYAVSCGGSGPSPGLRVSASAGCLRRRRRYACWQRVRVLPMRMTDLELPAARQPGLCAAPAAQDSAAHPTTKPVN